MGSAGVSGCDPVRLPAGEERDEPRAGSGGEEGCEACPATAVEWEEPAVHLNVPFVSAIMRNSPYGIAVRPVFRARSHAGLVDLAMKDAGLARYL